MLSPFCDPPALLAHMQRDGDYDGKNEILRSLVVQSQNDHPDVATTVLLLALWPGLDAVYGRLQRYYRHDPELLATDLIERATNQLLNLNLDRVKRIAATVIRNVERDTRRDIQAEWRRPDKVCETDLVLDDVLAAPPSDDGRELHSDLCRELGQDGSIVFAVEVLGFSQKDVAQVLGLSHDAARKRHQRSLAKLRTLMDLD
ncbi:sigma-70 family RNA polymerase sigma factor [Pseudooceanicola sp.]|uniref:sigma-70 family RNA polymerase sigma factor n=1 Tax=Pseudooceanicola sp. TaxID=1914328 RepID=UPI0035C71162